MIKPLMLLITSHIFAIIVNTVRTTPILQVYAVEIVILLSKAADHIKGLKVVYNTYCGSK